MSTGEMPAADPVEASRSGTSEPTESRVMELLQGHVPLSLLMDLSAASGPNSEAIMDEEGNQDDA